MDDDTTRLLGNIQEAARSGPRFSLTISEDIRVVVDRPDGDVELRLGGRAWSLPRGTADALAAAIGSILIASRKRD